MCRGEIEFRIQGLPHSAVQEHDHIRKQSVQKLFHQFENHPNKEALQADLQQNRAFKPFSEQSKEMIYNMWENMEYFEICEISQHTMLQLYDILAKRYCVLHMRNMLKGNRKGREFTIMPMSLLERRRRSTQRTHCQEAKRMKERLFQESGQAHHRLHPREQVRMRPDQPFAWHGEILERVDPKTGWK